MGLGFRLGLWLELGLYRIMIMIGGLRLLLDLDCYGYD